MIPEAKIDPALAKLENLFADHCAHGAQLQGLSDEYAACGQFIGSDRTQRGLHGTAAALRVLAQGNSTEAIKLVPKLVRYIQNRPQLHAGSVDGKFSDDQANVIKLSEVLYALSFVQAAQSEKDALARDIAEKLKVARRNDKGWTYFLNASSPVENLPSAFAILSLCRHGYEDEIKKQIEILEKNALDSGKKPGSNIDESSVRIFCLFALAFRKDDLSPQELKGLKRAFIELWDEHRGLLHSNVEQNIEYSNGSSNYYVRIPWQLYLLALAARLDPKRISSLAAQRQLNHILEDVQSTGFRYPHTGSLLSSRTNAILFDVLQKLKRFNKRSFFHTVYYVSDAIRTFLSHRFFAFATLIAFAGVSIYFCYEWLTKSHKPEELGHDLVGAMIGLLITFIFERLRKSR